MCLSRCLEANAPFIIVSINTNFLYKHIKYSTGEDVTFGFFVYFGATANKQAMSLEFRQGSVIFHSSWCKIFSDQILKEILKNVLKFCRIILEVFATFPAPNI